MKPKLKSELIASDSIMIKTSLFIFSAIACLLISYAASANDQQKFKCTIYFETLTDQRFVNKYCSKSKCGDKVLEEVINQNCRQYLSTETKLAIQLGSTNKISNRVNKLGKVSFCLKENFKCDELQEKFGFCAPVNQVVLENINDQLLIYLLTR